MGKAKRLKEESANRTRQEFLATFFVNNGRDHIMCNGFHLVRTWHGITGLPVYMIYTQKSFEKYMQYVRKNFKDLTDKPEAGQTTLA